MSGNKHVFLVFAVFSAILVSGCINLEINQTIRQDGTSSVELAYNLSNIADMARAMNGTGPDIDEMRENMTYTCDEIREKARWSNVHCSVSDGPRITISGELDLSNSEALAITSDGSSTTYRYNVKDIYNTLSDVGEPQGQENVTDEQIQQAKRMAAMMNIRMDYTLKMPGKITSADIGEVNGDTVSMSLFDLAGRDAVYVESELSAGMDPALMAGIAVVIVIVVVAMVAMVLR